MWDQRYSEEGFAYGTEPNDFLKTEFARIRTGGRVLCLAEGEGRNAVFLAEKGYLVTAVDQSPVGLRKADGLAAERGVAITTVAADLAAFDFGKDAWDGIVSIAAHVPPPLRKQVHRKAAKSLKTGGILILEAYTARQLDMPGSGGPPSSQKELFMSLAELETELQGLEITLGAELDRIISEGRYHRGQSAVVQLVARKPGH